MNDQVASVLIREVTQIAQELHVRRPVSVSTHVHATAHMNLDTVVCSDGAVFSKRWDEREWGEDAPIPGTRRAQEMQSRKAEA